MRVKILEGKYAGAIITLGRTVRGVSYSEKEGAGFTFVPLSKEDYIQYKADREKGIPRPDVKRAIEPDVIWKEAEKLNERTLEEEREFSQMQALMRR